MRLSSFFYFHVMCHGHVTPDTWHVTQTQTLCTVEWFNQTELKKKCLSLFFLSKPLKKVYFFSFEIFAIRFWTKSIQPYWFLSQIEMTHKRQTDIPTFSSHRPRAYSMKYQGVLILASHIPNRKSLDKQSALFFFYFFFTTKAVFFIFYYSTPPCLNS